MRNEYRLYGVQSHSVDLAWSEVLPFLENALAYSDNKYEPSDIYKELKESNMQLWLVYTNEGLGGIVITNIINYPKSKRLGLVFVAGSNFKKWLHLWDEIREWARHQKCDSVELWGRPGWEKWLAKKGFYKIHTVLKADIGD